MGRGGETNSPTKFIEKLAWSRPSVHYTQTCTMTFYFTMSHVPLYGKCSEVDQSIYTRKVYIQSADGMRL